MPGSAEVRVGPPYDIPTLITVDPAGNQIHWAEPVSAAEQRARNERGEQMRRIIRERLEAGDGLPTADELVAAVGRPLGLALHVLNEFPEYEAATRPR